MRHFLAGRQLLLVAIAQQRHNALAELAGRQAKHLQVVLIQRKGNLRVGQRHVLKLVENVPHFHGVALEEVAPGGHVEKQVFDGDAGAVGAGRGLLAGNLGAFHQQQRAGVVLALLGANFDLRHGRDAGQRLAPEAQRADAKQVFGAADFAGGVALQAHAGIGGAHAGAVVDYLHQLLAGLFHNELHLGGAGIDGIFQQLLHHRGGALHHFAGRNLVGEVFGKQVNDIGHSREAQAAACAKQKQTDKQLTST